MAKIIWSMVAIALFGGRDVKRIVIPMMIIAAVPHLMAGPT
jgi:hypothetical protein